MSRAKLLDFNLAELQSLEFDNLERRLEQRLKATKNFPDLEELIKLMNPLLKAKHLSLEEQSSLRRMRQRAYDLRRNPKFQRLSSPRVAHFTAQKPIQILEAVVPKPLPLMPIIEPKISKKPEIESGVPMSTIITEKPLTSQPSNNGFNQGALRALNSIDGEHVVKTAPKLLLWLLSSALVSYLLWQQSVDLYQSAGFKDSVWAAAGGIIMIIGFAAFYAITHSKLALLLCLYVSSYEAYLMISGTVENEHQIQIQNIQTHPDLVFLKEKAAKSLAYYNELKARYDDPESKVFKNDWFLTTKLNPAWDESSVTHKELMAKQTMLMSEKHSSHITWLKILYRLGLVFLCMMLVHRFFSIFVR